MKDSIRKMLSLLLILTVMSMSCTGLFLAKYAKTFAVTDTLRVSFLSDMVNLLPGRVMNTYFDEDTQKIIFGAIVSDLPSTAKLVDPVNKDNYVLVPNTGQTNPAMTFVSGVTPSTFDPLDDTLYINYRANESTDDTGVYVFFDDISNYTYFVSVSRNIKYHFNAENEPDALNPGSVSEYNDFFYGLSDLEDIELKSGASWDTSDVRTFANFLKGCASIDDAELAQIISWIDPTSAYSFSGMYSGLTDVTTVDISDWDLSTVEGVDLSYMLSGMSSLTEVDFPSGAKKISLLARNGISHLFQGDTSLQYLNLSALPYCATTNDSAMFNGCSSLQTIVVAQDFVHSTVEPTESIFDGCTSLIGQAGTAYIEEYAADPSGAIGKSFAYIDGKLVDGVRHYGYYSDGSAVCVLTFDANGGVSGTTTEIREFTGTTVTIPASAETTKGLDTFVGWGLTDSASMPVYVTGDTLTLSSNITLYAIYEVTVHLTVGEELKELINDSTRHIVYCLDTELPSGIGSPIGTADLGGAGEIKVYYDSSTYTTYIASCVDANRVVFEFNENSESLYEGKTQLETISHTNTVYIDTSSVTRFRNMFKGCSSLQQNSLNAFLAEFDTSSAIQLNAMFSGVSVSYLDISSFDTSNVTDFSWMFQDMRNLTEINFGTRWDVSSADNHDLSYLSGQSGRNRCGLRDMFQRCTSLETIDLSNWTLNQTSYVDTTEMFDDCTSLTTIYSNGDFDWQRIDSRKNSNMFRRCTSLVGGNGTTFNSSNTNRVYARIDEAGTPGYFTDAAVKNNARISFDPFTGTAGLYDHISGTVGSTVTLTADYAGTPPAGHSFAGWAPTPGGPVVYSLGDTLTITGDALLYSVYNNDTTITSATLKTGEAILALLNSATTDVIFGKMSDLPARVSFIGNADVDNSGAILAFYKSGTTYFVVDSDEPAVTINFNANSDGMFRGKSNIARIRHTSGVSINTSSVTTFRDMFKNCTHLEEISLNALLADFDTSNAYQLNAMFSAVPVETLDISSFNTSNVTDFSYMFENMGSLTTIIFGPGWDVSSADNVTLAQGKYRCGLHATFFGCASLEEVDLSGWTLNQTGLVNTGEMFSGCTNLTTIYTDGSFDYNRIEGSTKDKDMFKDCTSLVGGNGTVFDPSKTNKEYALLDAPGTPGYFTDVAMRGLMLMEEEYEEDPLDILRAKIEVLSAEDRASLVEKFGEFDIDRLNLLEEDVLEKLWEEVERLSSEDTKNTEEEPIEEKEETLEPEEKDTLKPLEESEKEKDGGDLEKDFSSDTEDSLEKAENESHMEDTAPEQDITEAQSDTAKESAADAEETSEPNTQEETDPSVTSEENTDALETDSKEPEDETETEEQVAIEDTIAKDGTDAEDLTETQTDSENSIPPEEPIKPDPPDTEAAQETTDKVDSKADETSTEGPTSGTPIPDSKPAADSMAKGTKNESGDSSSDSAGESE